MPRLPSLTAKEVIRALKKAGFEEDRQKSSHLVMRHPATNARTVIPVHSGKTLKRPLLRAILDDAKLSPSEFMKLVQNAPAGMFSRDGRPSPTSRHESRTISDAPQSAILSAPAFHGPPRW